MEQCRIARQAPVPFKILRDLRDKMVKEIPISLPRDSAHDVPAKRARPDPSQQNARRNLHSGTLASYRPMVPTDTTTASLVRSADPHRLSPGRRTHAASL